MQIGWFDFQHFLKKLFSLLQLTFQLQNDGQFGPGMLGRFIYIDGFS